MRTSAAAAALFRASSPSPPSPAPAPAPAPGVVGLLLLPLPPPRVRGGPPTFRGEEGLPAAGGTEAEAGAAGVVPRRRPGCAKGSLSLLPLLQQLPIFALRGRFWVVMMGWDGRKGGRSLLGICCRVPSFLVVIGGLGRRCSSSVKSPTAWLLFRCHKRCATPVRLSTWA